MLVNEFGASLDGVANVDAKDRWGRTPLHIAAVWGRIEAGNSAPTLMRWMHSRGGSPLRHAFENHHYVLAHMLIVDFGADPANDCALGLTSVGVETFVRSGLGKDCIVAFPNAFSTACVLPCDEKNGEEE